MKKTIFMLLFGLLVCGAVSAQKSKLPAATFRKTVHDFGSVKEDGKITTVFEFTNMGRSPLIVNKVNASCGCTTPSFTQEPILPGKKGKIDVAYNTVGRPGTFAKTITVYTNVPDTIYVLTIKGTVIPKKQ